MTVAAPVENAIGKRLKRLDPIHIEVVNESFRHNVPEGAESHFKVVIVSEAFQGEKLVSRHRIINRLLKEEMEGAIHALAIHAMTPDEWFEKGGRISDSPQCLGGTGL